MMFLKRPYSRFWPVPVVILLCVVTYLSLTPLPQMPIPKFNMFDKVGHLIAYGAVATPIGMAKPRIMIPALISVFLWSGALELIQPYVNRNAEIYDLAVNGLGLVFGGLAGRVLRRLIRPRLK